MSITDKILIDQIGSGNACVLIRNGTVIDFFGDPPEKNICKDHINFGSIFFSVRDFDISFLGTSLEIVVFISVLGFGGNGLFGLDGAVICCFSGGLFFKGLWSLEITDS